MTDQSRFGFADETDETPKNADPSSDSALDQSKSAFSEFSWMKNASQKPSGPVINDPLKQRIQVEERNLSEEQTLDDFLRALINAGSSDLHLAHGLPPMARTHGDIRPIPGQPVLNSAQIERVVSAIMSDEQRTRFQQDHDLDLAYEIPGLSRFRVNVFRQMKRTGSVIRVIPNEIKTLQQLGMPSHLGSFAQLPRGLVLVTGPTGSGKSTTLAAIINEANKTRYDHILTIEDPVEFVHTNQKCIVNQREVGVDTASFQEGLRRALREDPDIILVGEMRDPETIQTAITAAETGHLVFGTLHTQSAAETMSRIIDSFPEGAKPQVQAQLAATIQGIVCQTLMKRMSGKGRVAALEILKGEPAIRALIRKGQAEQIKSALETGGSKGMQTLDMHLASLVKNNTVSMDEALKKISDGQDAFIKLLGGPQAAESIRRNQAALNSTPYGD